MIRYLIAALIGCLIIIYGGYQRIQSQSEDLATAKSQVTTLNKAADSRLDDAETRAELDPAAAERIVAIPADGDEAIHALTGLQDYVTKICLKGNAQ